MLGPSDGGRASDLIIEPYPLPGWMPLPYQPGGKLPDMQKAKEKQIARGWRQMETQELMSTLKVDILFSGTSTCRTRKLARGNHTKGNQLTGL